MLRRLMAQSRNCSVSREAGTQKLRTLYLKDSLDQQKDSDQPNEQLTRYHERYPRIP